MCRGGKMLENLQQSLFFERTKNSPTIVSGGFPCQPHSLAGKRMASDDERDLWSELFRVFCETNGKWLVAENVCGLLTSENGLFFGRILRDLGGVGCNVWWHCFPAYAVGAVYARKRISIVACADCDRLQGFIQKPIKIDTSHRIERPSSEGVRTAISIWNGEKRYTDRIRNHDGLSDWVDRLKCLGNAVVPQQFYPIFQAIAEIEKSKGD